MTENGRGIRVLLSRSLLDCHQRGLVAVAAALRDAGMEVVYTRFYEIEEVVKTALEEDVDVVGLSFMSWGQMHFTPQLTKQLKERGMDDVLVIIGGIIRKDQVPELEAMGVDRVFGAGSSTTEIVNYIVEKKGKVQVT